MIKMFWAAFNIVAGIGCGILFVAFTATTLGFWD
jgi:hypothetical protein